MTTKEQLLALLESSKGTYFSGEEIARRLEVSRAAVWKAVNALRQEGFPIDAVTNRGYCLTQRVDALSSEGILAHLQKGRDLQVTVLPTVTSTNAVLREKAGQGAAAGSVVVAGQQTAGRGRCGRAFYSPGETGLYFSVLLRPTRYGPQQITRLTAVAAVALCEAIETVTGECSGIKWVNDLFLHGKKVCGILTEGAFSLENGALEYGILGVGINLYPPKGGFPKELAGIAGSILDKPIPDGRNRLAAEFLNRFLNYYDAPEKLSYIEAYRRRSLVIGRQVTVLLGSESRSAYVQGIDDSCRLLVRYENGETDCLSYGEISVQV